LIWREHRRTALRKTLNGDHILKDDTVTPSFWSRSSVRWSATVILGIVFVLALVVFLTADLVSRDLLDPDLYNNALEEELFYDRIYAELLADPAMVEATALLLGNLGLDPALSTKALSFTTSTLYLVLPPETIQSSVEGLMNVVTAYFRGDTDELQPNLSFEGLDSDILADRILDGALAFIGEVAAEQAMGEQTGPSELDQELIGQYLSEISDGQITAFPADLANIDLTELSAEELALLQATIVGPIEDTISDSFLRQIEFALRSNDLPGALIAASREVLRTQVDEAAGELATALQGSEELNAVRSAAMALGRSTTELIDTINNVRALMITLDSTIIPLAFIVMLLSMLAIVWIHADNLIEMLRTAGVTLVIASGLVALVWLIIGFLLRNFLADQFLASSALPSSLESMITDVVKNLSSTVWRDVWRTATVPLVLGTAFLILSFFPRLPELAERWLKPVWRHRKLVIVCVVMAIILIPVGILLLRGDGHQEELVCNGHAELCDRPVNEVAYATTHNAMSIANYGWIWPSHDGTVLTQLNAGVRGFLIDSHYFDDQAWIESQLDALPPDLQTSVRDILDLIDLGKEDGNYLCHMMCGLGATELEDTLIEIRFFLEGHPNEVIVMVFEDLVTPADTEGAFIETGLDELVYTHIPGEPWPTLREMIEADKRVLVMAENEGSPPDWYLNAWDYTEETPYHFSELADFDETSCQPNRGDTGKPFFLLNHWITRASPSRVDAAVLNDYDYLLERAQRCADERGQIPNLVGVNFYLNGDVFDVVDELNGVREETFQ
jgi:hypothetical protein